MVPFRTEIGASVGGLYVQLDEKESLNEAWGSRKGWGRGVLLDENVFPFSQSMWVLFCQAMLGEDTRNRRKRVYC